MTATAARTSFEQEQAERRKHTRIARFMLPRIKDKMPIALDENSVLLPSDRWIVATARGLIRDNKDFRRRGARLAAAALTPVATFAAGIAAIIIAPVLLTAAIAVAATAAVSVFCLRAVKRLADRIKREDGKLITDTLQVKYAELKIAEFKRLFTRKAKPQPPKMPAAEKPAAPVAKKPIAPLPAPEKADVKTDVKTEAKPKLPPKKTDAEIFHDRVETAKETAQEIATLSTNFGKWAFKKAKGAVQKKKPPQDDAGKKPKP